MDVNRSKLTKNWIAHLLRWNIASFFLWGTYAFADDVYREDAKSISRGNELFQTNCSACHDFSRDGSIGPGLGRVTGVAFKSWIEDFIRNSQAMVEAEDLRALKLFDEYKTVMPSYDFSEEDMESLLAYIYSEKRERKRRRSQVVRQGVISDPVVESVEPSGLGLVLEPFVCVPRSNRFAPQAKINKMAGVIDGEKHRLFVNDIRGFLYEIVDGEAVAFLDVAKRFPNFISKPGFATGMTSFAFSPAFEKDGLLYTHHAETPAGKLSDFVLPNNTEPMFQYVLVEWKTDETRSRILEGQGREIMRIDMFGTAHGVQEIAFNPSVKKGDEDYGNMYVGIGDGSASYKKRMDLFDGLGLVWGKVLRIDPKGNNSKNGKYGIPPNNPFVVGTQLEASESESFKPLEEIFASGVRNPNTLSWTPDGKLLVTDIGHHHIEELNWVESGKDYGWPTFEGEFEIDLLNDRQRSLFTRKSNSRNAVDPVVMLDHDEIVAIAGGFAIPSEGEFGLGGKYVFGGIANGRVFMIDLADVKKGSRAQPRELQLIFEGEIVTVSDLVKYRRADLRFGQDAAGGLYLMSKTTGCIWEIVGIQKID
ncbi:PQQ-dependent sugar dehydrogenase [Puniceicoccaceae bacterium K14]|nr:PQQ-dependent sugar dehydrogenase [Puniceicoccaceae bacterium K14]